MTLKELRKKKNLTQAACAKFLGIPLRTYQNYETVASKVGSIKYDFMMQKLEQYGLVDETHGILTIEQIKNICSSVFEQYSIDYCYLFGCYAKENATELSDVDLLLSTSISGMQFYDLVESLREALHKKVDALNLEQLNDNPELTKEILKDGIKIYGQHK